MDEDMMFLCPYYCHILLISLQALSSTHFLIKTVMMQLFKMCFIDSYILDQIHYVILKKTMIFFNI